MSAPASQVGLVASLRRLAGTAIETGRVRLELFGSELEQEKLRLFDALALAAIGLVMLGLALVLVIGFVVLLFQEGYRLPAVGVLALAFGGIGAWLLRRARDELRSRDGGPFALTLGELRRDHAELRRDEATSQRDDAVQRRDDAKPQRHDAAPQHDDAERRAQAVLAEARAAVAATAAAVGRAEAAPAAPPAQPADRTP